ncbi:MAG: dihydropteroate synthase [Flavobacteriaceae bacterium]
MKKNNNSITCNGELIDLNTPKVMGILNLTPDSFFDGGKYSSEKKILKQTKKMLKDGATFIDIGAYSSRPNAKHITETEELNRLLPIIKLLIKTYPKILISVDTFRSKVADEVLKNGACMINDISGGNLDENIFSIIAKHQVPYVLMHMKGSPQTMQNSPNYNDIIIELENFFTEKINILKEFKIDDIILDLGFGFGKTLEHNYSLLNNLEKFNALNYPILTGISRKSMLSNLLNSTPKKMKNATTIANTIALQKGTKILRVHDVKEAMECVKIVEFMKGN